MWRQYSGDRIVYLNLPFKISFFLTVYFKTSSFKNYINNHLGFSFLMSGLFPNKYTKQAYLCYWLVSLCFFEKRDGGFGGRKKSRQESRGKRQGYPVHTLPLGGALPMISCNLEAFKWQQQWLEQAKHRAFVYGRKIFQHL